jgi:6-phosphogluconolactonase (cycloisomerase 2 family)
MTLALRLGALALATSAAAALAVAGPAAAAAPTSARSANHAVFVQTDDPAGNHVAAYYQHADGSLTLQHTYATGGLGGILDGSVVDHLASQGAVTYDRAHHLLYVVNAGSNTVSVFGVDGARLHRHEIVGSDGSFPVSIAVHGDSVFVLDGHDGGAIQGYRVWAGRLVKVHAWHRALGLDPTQLAFTESPGQVAFTPNGRHLIVTTKANGSSIDVFGINRWGHLSSAPVVTSVPGAVPFAVTFDRHGNLEVANAATSSVTSYTINPDGSLTQLVNASTGQNTTCWIVADGNWLFATNPGSASISTFQAAADGSLTLIGTTPTDPGVVDPALSANHRFLYAETGAAGIVDEFAIGSGGALTSIGSVTVADAVGAEGIATS